MENPPDQSSPAKAVDLQSPDPKVVRRKFVQTTLFPLKPHNTKVEEIPDDDDEAEVGGSQGGKKKRGRKPKGNTTPQKRGVKKVVDTKVEEIGDDDDVEEAGGSQGGKRKRGRNTKGNSTPSKRGSKKGTPNGKDVSVVAIDDTESPDDASPQQLKAKRRVSTKNGRSNGNKAASTSKGTHPVATLQSSQPVPDLWLEAKKTAEENSRIFAGKQIHPFFSSWKAGKKDLETTEVENNGCLEKTKERNVELGPVHVFDTAKDTYDIIDWSNWTFDDGIFSKKTCIQERNGSCFEGIVDSLNFNGIPSASNHSVMHLKDISLAQLRGEEGSSVLWTSVSPIVVDKEVTAYDPLANIEKERESCIYGNVGYFSSHFEQQNTIPRERITSYYLNRGNYPENGLWANKYHPEKALEVCGNSEAVKFINDWLGLWQATGSRVTKSSYSADKCSVKCDEYGLYDSDSDSENAEESGLKNVLLVTGPVGSGKSAAIYACAKEQGFQVIEVNSSDWRNGALLKQKFGEAVGSHLLKRSQESPSGKLNLKSSPVITNGAPAQGLNNGVVEVISLLEEEDYVGTVGSQYHSNVRHSCDKGDIKTLILFEDVDVTLCDDRGFISTIQQLADTGKRPMILTSNNESPLLPDNLDREEVCFTMPSQKELAHHIHLVCSAEKADIHPNLIERCIEFCQGDIRKTLMHLQFWCQSNKCIKDGKMQSITCPLMFNLEAGHCILPKLIPWALPSLLSEFVEAEVAKSFSGIEENHNLLGMIEEEEAGNIGIQNKQDSDIGETASIEAKKEAILSGNYFLDLDNDIVAGSNQCEFSNSSGTPVAFNRRNMRRKVDTVLSDSEDEICNHENLPVSAGLFGNGNGTLFSEVHSQFPVLHSGLEGASNEFWGQLVHPGAKEVEAETVKANHFNFFAQGNSYNQSTDPCVHAAEAKHHQQLEFVHANCSSFGEANDSLNLFNDLLEHTRDGKFGEAVDHEKFPTVGNSGNQSPCYFEEANRVEIGTGNEVNLCLNPLNDLVQHFDEEKVAVKRCLFPLPVQAGPISMAESQHQHLEMGTVNHDGPVAADASFNPSFDQLLSCSKANMANSEQQHPGTANGNPFCYTALGDSLNPSSDHLINFVEAKEKEIQNQLPEAGDGSGNSFAAVDGPILQLSNQFLTVENPEKIQLQHPEISDVKYDGCVQLDGSLKPMGDQSPYKDIMDFIGCPTIDNSLNPLDGKTTNLIEVTAEENQCQSSDTTNVNHVMDQCQSFNMSYVPESTYVPETEVNDGTECPSGTDLMEIVSRVTINNADPSDEIKLHQASEYRFCGFDINMNVRDEEMGDSHCEKEHLEPSTSGCPVMDECSRMDFFKRSKSFRNSPLKVKNYVHNSVQERWKELRQTDLGQYLIAEHKNALQLVDLGYRMSNLISEGDRLLHDYEYLLNDSSGLSEETYTFSWHDQQVRMALSIAQYGYFLYAKDIDALQSNMGVANNLHLGWEMLVSTGDSVALGKLLSLSKSQISLTDTSIKQATTVDSSSTREREMWVQNIVQSVVPLRSYLTVRGHALHDYLSSLTQISRSEASRLAEAPQKTKRRRVRVAKNYLSSGGINLSQDDILKLNEYDFCRKDTS
ncbi:hypothetical protein SOVF_014870 isoform A [Spinacia oleracea]|uniref:Uncharacterized protein isoform X2 n=1 Tax=Spinacia oleracea TaxID=3562 RepID=A0A9R0J1G1_SPIOL|nr:uncharacterized protein LOC110798529 isoform X2 [Spinacia oleracea]KNA24489.1 hypothetical protein SOVF_014870 isoform A [Spinacia oleracea]